MKNSLVVAFVVTFLFSCASSPDKIQKKDVSSEKYADHSCEQLASEFKLNSDDTTRLYKQLKETRKTDEAQAWWSLLFWPTLFWLEGGDGPEAQEYAELRGDRAALEKATVTKECNSNIIVEDPVDIIKREEEEEKRKRKEAASKSTKPL